MKKVMVLTAFSLILAVFGTAAAQTKNEPALQTVASVDLKQYSGKWFEIGRYPNKFQKECVGNTTATYTVNDDQSLAVVNQCVRKNGTMINAKGKARIVDKTTNAKLEVRFAPSALSFLSAVWGDYWIVDLDDKYQYAVVGDPKREYLWILSRTPEMSDAVYQNILRRIEEKGFNPAKIVKTSQKIVVIKGSTIDKS